MAQPVRFSRALVLALHTMKILAEQQSGYVPVRRIAAMLGQSPNHLAKVIQCLAHCGLLHCLRGPSGGVQLARRPAEITLRQVYEAIEGPLGEDEGCPFAHLLPGCASCPLGSALCTANRMIRAFLDGTCVEALCSETAGKSG